MELDFPLILVSLVAISGLVTLVDSRWGRPKRQLIQEGLKQAFPRWQENGSADARAYQDAVQQQVREPSLVEYSRSFFPVLAVVLVLRSFLVEPFQIPSSSMEPTLDVGDYILVNKFAYGLRLPVVGTKVLDVGMPERGDVMVFFPPGDSRYFIKRVIGLPGDHIVYRNKRLYINGEPLPMTLQAELPPLAPQLQIFEESLGEVSHQVRHYLVRPANRFEITVPEGHYFMMGDNRDNSSDSRYWGPVPEENIVGKAFAVWMHWDSFLSLPSFDRVGLIR